MIPVSDIEGVRHYLNVDHIVSIDEVESDTWRVNMAYGQSVRVDEETVAEIVVAMGVFDAEFMEDDDGWKPESN